MTTRVSFTETVRELWVRPKRPLPHRPNMIPAIRAAANALRDLGESEIQDRVRQLRAQVENDRAVDQAADEVLITGFSLVNEAARRAVGISYYDVQLMAGLALAQKAIAQMATGEGKTFVGALPAFFYGLQGRGVHFMTTNVYLAERDYEIVSPIFATLGMSLGILRDGDSPVEKAAAYACDVTYGPGYEFGFDYLRDQTALQQQPKPKLGETYRRTRKGQRLVPATTIQRGHAYAIIDELDSVLIDEATTPLILSGRLRASIHTPRSTIRPYPLLPRCRSMPIIFLIRHPASCD